MGGVGGLNPLPRVIGGAMSAPLKIHMALRAGVGGRDGGGAGVPFWEGGLEDRWRWHKAVMMSRGWAAVEQGALEHFPNLGTVNLSLWERTLFVLREASTHERQLAVAAVFTQPASAVARDIQAHLQETFDPAITIDVDTAANMTVTHLHKALGDRTGAVPFGPLSASSVPNFAGSYILRVTWPGTHTEADLAPVKRYLCQALPAWMDFNIFESAGFILGTSLLGMTALAWT